MLITVYCSALHLIPSARGKVPGPLRIRSTSSAWPASATASRRRFEVAWWGQPSGGRSWDFEQVISGGFFWLSWKKSPKVWKRFRGAFPMRVQLKNLPYLYRGKPGPKQHYQRVGAVSTAIYEDHWWTASDDVSWHENGFRYQYQETGYLAVWRNVESYIW